jgi:hypothetical protein
MRLATEKKRMPLSESRAGWFWNSIPQFPLSRSGRQLNGFRG